jgi:nucleoside-diphosphate-sugar epimerase
MRAAHIEPVALDIDRARRGDLSPVWIRDADLIYLVPPPRTGESDTRLDRFLQLLTEKPAVFVYASTTAVYGNTNGAEVTESAATSPTSARGQRRVSAEHMTRVWCTENEVRRVVLRLPAIYGPGRLPLDRLRRGEPTVRDADCSIVNRIHVDDLVQVILAALRNPHARGVYNVSDGNACTLTHYLNRVAAVADLPPPPQVGLDEAQLTFAPEHLAFFLDSRRISNQRLREELSVVLKYADLDAGIRASLEEEAKWKRK